MRSGLKTPTSPQAVNCRPFAICVPKLSSAILTSVGMVSITMRCVGILFTAHSMAVRFSLSAYRQPESIASLIFLGLRLIARAIE